ncbi:MAG: hypothetical protein ACKOQ3_10895 [Novosphingobium sp.]
MRHAAACLGIVLLLAGCAQSSADADDGEAIFCALGGSREFKPDCRLERTAIDAQPVFVVRHPDGGFRRLAVSKDGQHLDAVDGADASQSALKGDRWEVILGGDKYVIPVAAPAEANAKPQ